MEEKLQTVTIVISNCNIEGIVEVIWSSKDKKKTWANLPTGANTIHIQGHRSQNCYHRVEVNKSKVPADTDLSKFWRAVFSIRMTDVYQQSRVQLEERLAMAIPSCIGKPIYTNFDRWNILSHFPFGVIRHPSNSGEAAGSTTEEMFLERGGHAALSLAVQDRDIFLELDQWPYQDMSEERAARPGMLIGTGGESWEVLTSAEYMRNMMENGCTTGVEVVIAKNNKKVLYGPMQNEEGVLQTPGSLVDSFELYYNNELAFNRNKADS